MFNSLPVVMLKTDGAAPAGIKCQAVFHRPLDTEPAHRKKKQTCTVNRLSYLGKMMSACALRIQI